MLNLCLSRSIAISSGIGSPFLISCLSWEALGLSPNYQPNSVNTDGWWATQNAWKKLFPSIAVIECFLHAFLKVRDRATKKMNDYFNTAADKIWNCYRTESKRQLAQQIRRLREWTIKNVANCPMKDNILKLCKKKKKWSKPSSEKVVTLRVTQLRTPFGTWQLTASRRAPSHCATLTLSTAPKS